MRPATRPRPDGWKLTLLAGIVLVAAMGLVSAVANPRITSRLAYAIARVNDPLVGRIPAIAAGSLSIAAVFLMGLAGAVGLIAAVRSRGRFRLLAVTLTCIAALALAGLAMTFPLVDEDELQPFIRPILQSLQIDVS